MTRWRKRAFWVAVIYVTLDVLFVVLDFRPDHLKVALLVLLTAAVFFAVWDNLGDSGPPWGQTHERPMVQRGNEIRLAGYVRMIESHQTAAVPDAAVRDRLAALADERLHRRHGLTRDDPAAETLLGDQLMRDLSGPVRRMSRTDIEHHLERIEKL